MINVLIVEDSRLCLDYLVFLLSSDPDIRVMATASNGHEAVAYLEQRRPDLILMDIHMPGMDGFEATRRIMAANPVPIVICTASANFQDVDTAMRSLEAGALAVVNKPRGLADPDAEAQAAALIRTVKLMSEVKVVRRWNRPAARSAARSAVGGEPMPSSTAARDAAIVAIGASTGGPPVISKILSGLPSGFPLPILVVQHISAGFTAGFAEWLAYDTGMPVAVAQAGQTPLPGHVYVAPDDQHLLVGLRGELQLTRGEPHNGLRPSVGVLFRSVAERFGRRAIGVILTGMGRDGAEELKLMADRGALTVAQDEESCVVFGMPGEAVRLGAAQYVFSPQKIAELLLTVVQRQPPGRKDHDAI